MSQSVHGNGFIFPSINGQRTQFRSKLFLRSTLDLKINWQPYIVGFTLKCTPLERHTIGLKLIEILVVFFTGRRRSRVTFFGVIVKVVRSRCAIDCFMIIYYYNHRLSKKKKKQNV